MDNEIKGTGNSYAYTYRIHDPRIGRFLSIDPLFAEFEENVLNKITSLMGEAKNNIKELQSADSKDETLEKKEGKLIGEFDEINSDIWSDYKIYQNKPIMTVINTGEGKEIFCALRT